MKIEMLTTLNHILAKGSVIDNVSEVTAKDFIKKGLAKELKTETKTKESKLKFKSKSKK